MATPPWCACGKSGIEVVHGGTLGHQKSNQNGGFESQVSKYWLYVNVSTIVTFKKGPLAYQAVSLDNKTHHPTDQPRIAKQQWHNQLKCLAKPSSQITSMAMPGSCLTLSSKMKRTFLVTQRLEWLCTSNSYIMYITLSFSPLALSQSKDCCWSLGRSKTSFVRSILKQLIARTWTGPRGSFAGKTCFLGSAWFLLICINLLDSKWRLVHGVCETALVWQLQSPEYWPFCRSFFSSSVFRRRLENSLISESLVAPTVIEMLHSWLCRKHHTSCHISFAFQYNVGVHQSKAQHTKPFVEEQKASCFAWNKTPLLL